MEQTPREARGSTERPGEEDRRKRRSRRGFASMDPSMQRRIASLGGRAAHARGTAHEFTSEEARRAGQKGGRRAAERRRETGTQGT